MASATSIRVARQAGYIDDRLPIARMKSAGRVKPGLLESERTALDVSAPRSETILAIPVAVFQLEQSLLAVEDDRQDTESVGRFGGVFENIFRLANEGCREKIDLLSYTEDDIVSVFIRQGRKIYLDVGQADTLS